MINNRLSNMDSFVLIWLLLQVVMVMVIRESPVNHCIQCTCCVDPCVCVSWHGATLPMLNQHDNWDSSCQETRKRCHINKQ